MRYINQNNRVMDQISKNSLNILKYPCRKEPVSSRQEFGGKKLSWDKIYE